MKPEVEVFKALSDETRIRIMKLLAGFKKPICVCEIVDSMRLPQYLISRHLNILRRAGLLEDSRDGTWVSYSVPEEPSPLVRQLIQTIKQSMEGGIFDQDRQRLRLRLSLRQKGRCIVGYDNRKFSRLVRKLEKQERTSNILK